MTDATRTPRLRAALLAALCLLAAPFAAFAQESGQKDDVRRLPKINAEPLNDFLLQGKWLLEAGELGPNSTFEATFTGELNGSAQLKPGTVQSNYKATDVAGMRLAALLMYAVNQSRLLSMLDGAKEVRLSVKLDQHAFSVSASSELESEKKASHYVRGYGLLFHAARFQKKGTRLEELYSGMSFASEGKRFVMKLELPRESAVRLFREASDGAPAADGAGRN